MNHKDYAFEMRRDVERLQTVLRFLDGEKLDDRTKKAVISDLRKTVQDQLRRLQHALAAFSDESPEGQSVATIKDEGAHVRASVRWAIGRIEKTVADEKDTHKKRDLQKFLEDIKAKRDTITADKNRKNTARKLTQWKELQSAVEKKEKSLEAAHSGISEEIGGRKFREE
jgi:hypothetical protein